jgi:hypothetical protein
LPESAIARHEGFEHVRDQYRRIDRLAMGLRMQRGIALEIGLQRLRAVEREKYGLRPRKRPEAELGIRRTHGESLL